jgi:hypothetical protein
MFSYAYLQYMCSRKLVNQGFLVVKMKPSLRKLYDRHHDLINRYGISMSQITTDIYPSSLMAYNLIIDKSKSTGATSRSGTATFPVHLCGVRVSLVFYVVLCRSYCLSFLRRGGLHCIICPSNYRFGLPVSSNYSSYYFNFVPFMNFVIILLLPINHTISPSCI